MTLLNIDRLKKAIRRNRPASEFIASRTGSCTSLIEADAGHQYIPGSLPDNTHERWRGAAEDSYGALFFAADDDRAVQAPDECSVHQAAGTSRSFPLRRRANTTHSSYRGRSKAADSHPELPPPDTHGGLRREIRSWLPLTRSTSSVPQCDDSRSIRAHPGALCPLTPPCKQRDSFESADADAAFQLSLQLTSKPPKLICALACSIIPICQHFDSFACPNAKQWLCDDSSGPLPTSGIATSLSLVSKSYNIMDRSAQRTGAPGNSTDVRVLKAGVLYLRMHEAEELVKPIPHLLAKVRGEWIPYVCVLAQCQDSVSLFIYDVDETNVVEVAEIEVHRLLVNDIYADDESLFGSSFGFHIYLSSVHRQQPEAGTSPDADDSIATFSRTSRQPDRAGSLHMPSSLALKDHGALEEIILSALDEQNGGEGGERGDGNRHSIFLDLAAKKRDSRREIGQTQMAVEKAASRPKRRAKSTESRSHQHVDGDLQQLAAPHKAASSSARGPPTMYFSALRAADRNDWLACLRTYAQPDIAFAALSTPSTMMPQIPFRVERSMWVNVVEIRGLHMPYNVAATLTIDGFPVAQTAAKLDTQAPRWDDAAFFVNSMHRMAHGIYILAHHQEHEADSAHSLLGYCYIPAPMLGRKHMYDGWYPLMADNPSSIDKHIGKHLPLAKSIEPSENTTLGASARAREDRIARQKPKAVMPFRSGDIHVQVRYDELIVLSKPFYEEASVLLFESCPLLLFDLAAVLPKSTDWLVETVTKIAIRRGVFVQWIEVIVNHELRSQNNRDPALLFRCASVATRIVDTFMKLVGLAYVDNMIGDVVRDIAHAEYNCEVDPTRTKGEDCVEDNWKTLSLLLHVLWRNIEGSMHACPDIIRQVFSCIRTATKQHFSKEDYSQVQYTSISGFVFLRLICPALLSPKSFGIVSKKPSPVSMRTLTLMAKGIQSAANLADIGMKEYYMRPMNTFVQWCMPLLKGFIDFVATDPSKDPDSDRRETRALSVGEAILAVDEERECAVLYEFIYFSWPVLAQAVDGQLASTKSAAELAERKPKALSALSDKQPESARLPSTLLPPFDAISPTGNTANSSESTHGFIKQKQKPSRKQPGAWTSPKIPAASDKRRPAHVVINLHRPKTREPPADAADPNQQQPTDRNSKPLPVPEHPPPTIHLPAIHDPAQLRNLIHACGVVSDCVNACLQSDCAPTVLNPVGRKSFD